MASISSFTAHTKSCYDIFRDKSVPESDSLNAIMKRGGNNAKRSSELDCFGRSVVSTLRRMLPKQQAQAKNTNAIAAVRN